MQFNWKYYLEELISVNLNTGNEHIISHHGKIKFWALDLELHFHDLLPKCNQPLRKHHGWSKVPPLKKFPGLIVHTLVWFILTLSSNPWSLSFQWGVFCRCQIMREQKGYWGHFPNLTNHSGTANYVPVICSPLSQSEGSLNSITSGIIFTKVSEWVRFTGKFLRPLFDF